MCLKGIGNYGGAIHQALLSEQFPSGNVYWGGKNIARKLLMSKLARDHADRSTVNSMVLDLNGILFAIQLVVLLVVGPYADYGNWRPWLLIGKRASHCLSV